MGTYCLSTHELVEAMAKGLDDLEGDFGNEVLLKAIDKMKEYPYISDKDINDGRWRKFLDG